MSGKYRVEAATETIYLFFFSRSNRFTISRRKQEGLFVCRTDMFSKRVYSYVLQQTRNFIERTCFFKECLNICSFFPGGYICSSNRHEFSRRVNLFVEQTQIFQEGYSKRHVFLRSVYLFVEQILLSHWTDANFHKNPY